MQVSGSKAELVARLLGEEGSEVPPATATDEELLAAIDRSDTAALSKLKVAQLKVVLRAMGLPLSGKKAVLVERIAANAE